jgi:hypothetical protein
MPLNGMEVDTMVTKTSNRPSRLMDRCILEWAELYLKLDITKVTLLSDLYVSYRRYALTRVARPCSINQFSTYIRKYLSKETDSGCVVFRTNSKVYVYGVCIEEQTPYKDQQLLLIYGCYQC